MLSENKYTRLLNNQLLTKWKLGLYLRDILNIEVRAYLFGKDGVDVNYTFNNETDKYAKITEFVRFRWCHDDVTVMSQLHIILPK